MEMRYHEWSFRVYSNKRTCLVDQKNEVEDPELIRDIANEAPISEEFGSRACHYKAKENI